jgi:hypothetical protein
MRGEWREEWRGERGKTYLSHRDVTNESRTIMRQELVLIGCNLRKDESIFVKREGVLFFCSHNKPPRTIWAE